ncbi:hypothetical protein CEXT_469291 [Caerostris extrusa]|uniref:Ycf15 n=1 Tax=Caerostris extrusa TaxID=172846 RepID=A0AAV4NDZ9_CAEEX|nr:hypothetical protein CEXT_469291 [Caerostris extrusa]
MDGWRERTGWMHGGKGGWTGPSSFLDTLQGPLQVISFYRLGYYLHDEKQFYRGLYVILRSSRIFMKFPDETDFEFVPVRETFP